MRPIHRRSITLVALAALVALPLVAAPAAAASPGSGKGDAIAYWTRERIASAKPRDMFREPDGQAKGQKGKPGGGGGGGSTELATTSGSQWPDFKGKIYTVVGKVLFTMEGSNWICSGAAATDPRGDISVVLTAAHCAYDNDTANGGPGFATHWVFYPEFDTTPTYSCADAIHGCWEASRIVVHGGYADAGGFTDQATRHDWAFVVVGYGGKSNSQQLDALGSFPIAFTSYASGTTQSAFGYPAAGKYRGSELVYCHGSAGFDPWNDDTTYRLSCDMTGGSSGGPWLVNFDASGNNGTISSLNSYGYSGVKAMHGPKFNSATQATWNEAIGSGTGNAIVR